MNPLTYARRDLEGRLAGVGVSVFDHVPETVNPPCVLLQPADPFLALDPVTYGGGTWVASYQLFCLVGRSDNAQQTDDLDVLVCAVLEALPLDTGEVSAPFLATVGGDRQYLTARVSVSAALGDLEDVPDEPASDPLPA